LQRLEIKGLADEREELRDPEGTHGVTAGLVVLGERRGELGLLEENDVVENPEKDVGGVGEAAERVARVSPVDGAVRVEKVKPLAEAGELAAGVDGAGSEVEACSPLILRVRLGEVQREELGGILQGLVEVAAAVRVLECVGNRAEGLVRKENRSEQRRKRALFPARSPA